MEGVVSFRPLEPGIGEAVGARTVLRTVGDRKENWGEVADRVSLGNVLLDPFYGGVVELARTSLERKQLRDHIAMGRILMSGRHLQHGDESQPTRNQEVFTNCSTAIATFAKFYLLLNGSGVGRSYDDVLMVVNWDNLPEIVCALGAVHADYEDRFPTPEKAREIADAWDRGAVYWFEVPDSREGWAKAVEMMERMAFAGVHKNDLLVLDFSLVRPKGSPIGGMQNRPASGPVPLMEAILDVASIKGRGWKPWKQAMYADHYLAACVAVGGARRAARIAVKNYKDSDIIEFINIKRDGGLWTANNSIGVDAEFWEKAAQPGTREAEIFEAACQAAYMHGTGEPGFVNLDKLVRIEDGLEVYADGKFMGSEKYAVDPETELGLLKNVHEAIRQMPYKFIVNPCGEVVLFVGGGYCVIADVAPFHAETLDEARDAFIKAARALVRVNLMDSLYKKEVRRTNRIGVGFTGIHEFAWKHFGLTFRDLIQGFDVLMRFGEELNRYGYARLSEEEKAEAPAWKFWSWMLHARLAVELAATWYAQDLGVAVPHTFTTVKPAGTTSKLFGLSEGAHLPAMKEYLRWVQFQEDDPLIEEYVAKGYPVKRVPQYPRVVMVGFPTQPVICRLGIPDELLVTAPEATMEEQYKWVRLIETFWLGPRGNQVSYTLKYDTEKVSYEEYKETVLKNQPHVRAISVLPTSDWRVTAERYGYVPEEPVEKAEYDELVARIQAAEQVVTLDELQCASGACPI